MVNEKISIKCPHLILCEGEDELHFLISYLGKLIKNGEGIYGSFQVLSFGGNEQLTLFIETLASTPQYDGVKSITIIRDAEKDFIAAVQSIRSSLSHNGFSAPQDPCQIALSGSLKIGFALFPALSDAGGNGTLEDLCLNNLSENAEEILGDIECFLISLQHRRHREFPRYHKSKLHTYLSVTDKYVGLKIGEAAKANAVNFECEELQRLKCFLKEMAN